MIAGRLAGTGRFSLLPPVSYVGPTAFILKRFHIVWNFLKQYVAVLQGSHILYFGIKVPKSSKKGTNFAPRPQKIVDEKTRSISATICCDLCTAVQYGYWHKCSYSHQNYSISRSGISIIQPARVDAGCTLKWQLPTTSTVNTNSSAGENRFMHQSVYAVYASIRKIRGTRKQISVAS